MADCTCYPCTRPAYGAPGIAHCAACCYGSGIEEYDHLCPRADHRDLAVRQFGALRILDNEGRATLPFRVAATREMPDMTDHTHRFDGTMRCMGCGKHHDDLVDRTQYRLFHNLDARFSRAGTVEDRYLTGHEGEITVDDLASHESACELIFARHNRDDRPDGRSRPSLSVGDVIVLTRYQWNEDQGPMVLTYTVDRLGFQILPHPPQEVLSDYPEGYFEETRR